MNMNESMKQAAIDGLQAKADKLKAELSQTMGYINSLRGEVESSPKDKIRRYKRKRKFSKATRDKMAEAQRKRWASFRESTKA